MNIYLPIVRIILQLFFRFRYQVPPQSGLVRFILYRFVLSRFILILSIRILSILSRQSILQQHRQVIPEIKEISNNQELLLGMITADAEVNLEILRQHLLEQEQNQQIHLVVQMGIWLNLQIPGTILLQGQGIQTIIRQEIIMAAGIQAVDDN